MKLMHLSDLHLGKRTGEFSMLEDQEYILNEILDIINAEQPQCVLIAGDVYDKSVPSAEAVQLFDGFLSELSRRKLHVFIISGNHDSPERIAFGARIMDRSGIHMSPVYNGNVTPVTLSDEYGDVKVYMLPFIKPAHVRRYFADAEIESYTDAVSVAVAQMDIDASSRNVLITHQFVTGAVRSESEDINVGGADNVDASAFNGFDYVALGHLHMPQCVDSDTLRYCGSPIKYSFSEAKQQKSVTLVELYGKGDIIVRAIPLTPIREMREIRGAFADLMKGNARDYLHVTLTDEEDIPEAVHSLRTMYPYLMKLDYDNTRTRENKGVSPAEAVELKRPIELFAELYLKQNNQPMSEEQLHFASKLIESIWEGEA